MTIQAKPWTKKKHPRRVLAIRWQAMGDVIITLPYLQHLRNSLPENVRLDLLTRKETEDIPRNVELFDRIFSFGGERNFKKQLFCLAGLLPRLIFRRYDVVIDLQNNIVSRTLVKLLAPKAWSIFDKTSRLPAGERTRLTIEAAGLGECGMDSRFTLKNRNLGMALLYEKGWNESEKLVILNPAGFVATRNWDIRNYAEFSRLWLNIFPRTKFLVLGTSFIAGKAAFLQEELGNLLIDLTGRTTPAEAFAIVRKAALVLSEDSGLMHMAWVSGAPTMVLFGSTSSYWARPLGEHSFFLDSSDLPCGNCMQSFCRTGDTRCLSRYTPELVIHHSLRLIQPVNAHTHATG